MSATPIGGVVRSIVSGALPVREGPNDEQLERAWRAGSRTAFEDLFRRHYPAVVAYTQRYTQDHATAEDIVQQAFLNVLQKKQGQGSFKSLVYTVARNLALNERRRLGRKYVAKSGLGELDPARPQPHPLADMIRHEELDAFQRALNALPPSEREAFCLKETRGLTYSEVGRVMGLHPDAVRRRVAKAYTLIRHSLKSGSVS